MDVARIIFRKDKETNEILAFIENGVARYGNILGYTHIGQHFESPVNYYKNATIKATEDEYKPLLEELKEVYGDYTIEIKKRLNMENLRDMWKYMIDGLSRWEFPEVRK